MDVFDIGKDRILFCKVHLMRTLMRNCKINNVVYKLMIRAVHERDEQRMVALVGEALAASGGDLRKYLEKNWSTDAVASDVRSWAMCYRQHSPFLLQNTTTNAIESYHNLVKLAKTKRKRILSACQKLLELNGEREMKARLTASNIGSSFNRRLKKDLPGFERLPIKLQDLIEEQLDLALKKIVEGKDTIAATDSELSCWCNFQRSYLLPCRHILLKHLLNVSVLTPENISTFVRPIEEEGLSVYEVGDPPEDQIRTRTVCSTRTYRRATRLKAIQEEHIAFYYELERRRLSDIYYEAYITA
jgi:hypothetical protein